MVAGRSVSSAWTLVLVSGLYMGSALGNGGDNGPSYSRAPQASRAPEDFQLPAPSVAAAQKAPTPQRVNKIKIKFGGPAQKSVETITKVIKPPFAYEEAINLVVPNQKYLLKFEDEESFGRAATVGASASVTFTPEDVEKFKNAVVKVSDYRNYLRGQCGGASSKLLMQALERYLWSLSSFNRKGLPLVADISENNNVLVLVVNRTALTDAPVLISRYLQFKKQRHKESMDRFLPADTELIANMVTIANVLKVEISEQDWNKSYGLRENSLEALSLWPREVIFDATARLAELKEGACVVQIPSQSALAKEQYAEPSKTITPAE